MEIKLFGYNFQIYISKAIKPDEIKVINPDVVKAIDNYLASDEYKEELEKILNQKSQLFRRTNA